MKITKFGSATVLIETDDVRVLCDPWLTDGAYYGAWHNYPPIDLEQCDFSTVDYVYISHIHPDHFDPKTMNLIRKDTPVLIHNYHQKFLKANIERLGFKVIELRNRTPYHLGGDTNISIFAADDCDPTICGNMFGCITSDIKGSMQIDSLCVINDGKYVTVNTNDCPYGIAKDTLKQVKKYYPIVDFALVGYTSASLYPHCMMDYSPREMEAGIKKAKLHGLTSGLQILQVLKPKSYMPFAGEYILGGMYYKKNVNRPLVEVQDAVSFFQKDHVIAKSSCIPVLLNFKESFDLFSKEVSTPYVAVDVDARDRYIKNVASKFKYSFESAEMPSNQELFTAFTSAVLRLRKKQNEIGFFKDINYVFDINDTKFVCINLINTIPQIIEIDELNRLENYQRYKLDPRLLNLVLKGPKHANWNNIGIGSLLEHSRKPDVQRKDVHILLNALHI